MLKIPSPNLVKKIGFKKSTKESSMKKEKWSTKILDYCSCLDWKVIVYLQTFPYLVVIWDFLIVMNLSLSKLMGKSINSAKMAKCLKIGIWTEKLFNNII